VLTAVNSLPATTVQQNNVVFPNPFSRATNIVFSDNGKHYIALYDIAGRQIRAFECNGKQCSLQCGNLAPGIYLIKTFDSAQQYIATTKVIIQ
jgi:hypothetical protein